MTRARTELPTDPEYGEKNPTPECEQARMATTVRVPDAEDYSTLRLGSEELQTSMPPAPQVRYEDLRELARGGMSSVREVFDRTIGRRVAMKVFDGQRAHTDLAAFVAEAQTTARLQHPNIVPVHDLQLDPDGVPSRFTMKLVEGQTLAELIAHETDRGSRPPGSRALERLLGVFLKVCDAVAYAHSRGVIHRDLKPSNVMVGSHGQVYVMDWGISLRRSPAEGDDTGAPLLLPYEPPGTLCGTPAFMAPEQAHGRVEDIDERTDVYGLGGILYAVLTQAPPHAGGSATADLALAKCGEVKPPQELAPPDSLPPGLCRIAMRALAEKSDDRYPTVDALKRDVEQFVRGGGWFATVRFEKGEIVLREGDQPDAAYILLQGQCELFRGHGEQRRFMRLLGPGEVFGETSIFGSSTRTASVSACSDVTLLRVTREALDRELGRSEWMQAFVEALAERFIEVDQELRRLQDER